MLHIYPAASLQESFEQLLPLMAEYSADRSPFQPDMVVVPNNDTGRWLQIHLADALGISANLSVEMPASFMRRLYEKMDVNVDEVLAGKQDLHWLIHHLLITHEENPKLSEIRNYIYAGDENERTFRRWQLAAQLADIFDQYQMYRPDWLAAWQKGKQPKELVNQPHAHWQQFIWQLLQDTFPELTGRAALQQQLIDEITSGRLDKQMPDRMFVFSVPSMAPLLLETFMEIAKKTEVHWFETDVRSSSTGEDSHTFLQKMVAERNNANIVFWDAIKSCKTPWKKHDRKAGPQTPSPKNILQHLQGYILSNQIDAKEFPADDSLSVHSCHGPLREVEILYDHVLNYLNEHPEKDAGDILVAVPDISRYAPYFEAVFGSPEKEEMYIPYDISDPESGLAAEVSSIFLQAVSLANSAFRVTDIVTLLDCAPVRTHYELDTRDIDLLEKWIRETNIRWGWDGEQHAGEYTHSWRFGLDRMMMGIACEPGYDQPMHEILPYTEIEGAGMLRVLGTFRSFLEILHAFRSFSQNSHRPDTWMKRLTRLLIELFPDDQEYSSYISNVKKQLQELEKVDELWNTKETIGADQVSEWLESVLGDARVGLSYRSGRLIISSMVPVRRMPFDMIALLGMNEGQIPVADSYSGFDLMGVLPRPGDRSRRNQDRAMFLETVLSAGSALHLSYTGHDPKDNTEFPPSLLITEIIETLESFTVRHGDEVIPLYKYVFRDHSLQGFSEKYFRGDDARYFSFSQSKSGIAGSLAAGNQTPFFALDKPLPEKKLEEQSDEISLDELIRFFQKPLSSLLQKSVDIRLPYDDSEDRITDYRDIWQVNKLDEWFLKDRLLQAYQSETSADEVYRYFKAKGVFPRTEISKNFFDGIDGQIRNFIDLLKENELWQKLLPPQEFRCTVDVDGRPVTVSGTLKHLTETGQQFLKVSSSKPKYELVAWLHHLAYLLATDTPGITQLITYDKGKYAQIEFQNVDDPADIMADLIRQRELGLRKPMYAYPKTSGEYSQQILKGKDTDVALSKARVKFFGNFFNTYPDSSDDPAISYLLRNQDPLDSDAFKTPAEIIWKTIYEHKQESRKK